MNLKRSRWQESLHAILSIVMSASLLLALVPCASAQATEGERWSDTIDEMLAYGGYAEGEAIVALYGREDDALRAQADLPVDAFEPLMEVSAEAAGVHPGEGLSPQAQRGVTLSLVTSDSLTTEEILRSLVNDPRVAFAEPNYYAEFLDDDQGDATSAVAAEVAADEQEADVTNEPVSFEELPADIAEAEAAETAASADASKQDAADDAEVPAEPVPSTTEDLAPAEASIPTIVAQASSVIGDLTPIQWSNWDTTEMGIKPLGSSVNASINVPNFGSAEVGANMDQEVIVAVLDGPVDFTNPDLEDRAYTFSPELRAELGCDVHGFNASAESTDGKITHHFDFGGDSHGTHCAGIIGATWDGHGISGVASNARIVSIQMMDTLTEEENHKTSLASGLRAFNFVKRANDAGVGIKVASCSWGFYQVSKALDAAVYEVGESQGVVSVFASFNDTLDNDIFPADTSTLVDNPYAIVVAATNQYDDLASFSNYGTNTVTLAAPGFSILSTDTASRGIYLPAATPGSNILFEDFEDGTPIVTIQQFDNDRNPVGDPATICTDTHLVGAQSLEVPFDTDIILGGDDDGGWSFFDYQGFRIDFDLAEAEKQTGIDVVQALKEAQDLYLGFGFTTDKDYSISTVDHLESNATGDESINAPLSVSTPAHGAVVNTSIPLTGNDVAFDFDHLDGHLIIDVVISADEGCPALYIDEIGLGTQKVPYSFKNGTSMACPCISGATAVLASQTGLDGAKLASLVRSKIRIPDSGPLPVRTGGVFDFSVQGSPDSGEKDALAPAIQSLEVSGTTVTITGSNFGLKRGSVDLSRYVVGKEGSATAATVTSWTDGKVVLTLDEPFTGIMHAVLTNASGKFDTASTFVSKGETVYEQDLPFTSDTGEAFVFDNLGDFETKGPLVGLGCKLYYLPTDQRTELSPVCRRMFCFDLKTKTWSELPELPEALQGVSAVMYEGKLVVEGATVSTLPSGESSFIPQDRTQEERVYVYDPSGGAWSQASSEGMILGETILNDAGQLKLVGGYLYDEEGYASVAHCYAYDLATGLGEKVCNLIGVVLNPQAVAKDGVIYIYSPIGYWLVTVRDNVATMNFNPLPEIAYVDKGETIAQESNTREDPFVGWGMLSVASEGVILVGPPAADGSSDTYILRDGSTTFEPYMLRASDARAQSVASCTYRGRLFAIGSSWAEPEQRFFRATKMDVPEYPGDIPCEEDDPTPTPTPDPTPAPTPTPTPTPSPALPKTDDPTISTPILVMVGACGVAAVIAGIFLRRKNRR